MSKFIDIFKPILDDICAIGRSIKGFFSRGTRRTVVAGKVFARKNKRGIKSVFGRISAMSRMKKAFFVMAIYVSIFVVWQMFAYDFEQTVFVAVNLILVGVAAALICLILFKAKQTYNELRVSIDEQAIVKKKKDQEIASLKSELMQLRLASKNQVSFGKKSQALLDAVAKYYKEQKSDDPRGKFILKALAECYEICGGVIYYKNDESKLFDFAGEYALLDHPEFKSVGEDDGFVGLAVKNAKAVELSDVPADYFTVLSGLGQTSSIKLYVLPLKLDGQVVAVAEVSSFNKLSIVDVWSDIDNLILSSIKN